MAIPRRIIHVYSAPAGHPEELPLACRAAVASAKLLNPSFEHVLFRRRDIAAFIAQEYPVYETVFRSFPLAIQRFDFFRYLAVYRLGGFYLDLDVYLARSLEPLLVHDCVFPFEELTIYDFLRRDRGMDWELANYAFGAAPAHPFLRAVIDNCVHGVQSPAWVAMMMRGIPGPFQSQFVAPVATGPAMVSRTLAEHPELADAITVLFPPDVRDERHWHCLGDFGVHLMQGTWRTRDGFFRSKLARLWENRRRASLRCVSEALGTERRGPWRTVQSAPIEAIV